MPELIPPSAILLPPAPALRERLAVALREVELLRRLIRVVESVTPSTISTADSLPRKLQRGPVVIDVLPLPALAKPVRKRRKVSPLVADAKRLARLLCVGVRTVRTWDAAGKLPAPIRIGGRVVWILGGNIGIRAWLAAGAPPRDEWEKRKSLGRT